MIESGHRKIPLYRQCELLGLSRSSYYYSPSVENELNLKLMNLIDEQYTRTPFYGARKMMEWLRREIYQVNLKRVRRLMRLMGIEAIYPGPNLSKSSKEHRKYPYLLKGLSINRPDHVWCADITYIRMAQGFIYLVAIMDWFSRYVLAWELSNTLDKEFCLSALENALLIARPEIFNTDQGSQFSSEEFTGRLEGSDVRISMDGSGRVFDNIFIERLWRTVKYEEVYLNSYDNVREARLRLARYFQFYNMERLHASLGYLPPYEIYFNENGNTKSVQANKSIHLIQPDFLS